MMIERVNSELKKQISIVINNLRDPRIAESMVNVTEVATTGDLKYAKVYLSFFGEDKKQNKEALKVIANAASYIRNELKSAVRLRNIPELKFIEDTSTKYAVKIENILKTLDIKPEEPESAAETDEKAVAEKE